MATDQPSAFQPTDLAGEGGVFGIGNQDVAGFETADRACVAGHDGGGGIEWRVVDEDGNAVHRLAEGDGQVVWFQPGAQGHGFGGAGGAVEQDIRIADPADAGLGVQIEFAERFEHVAEVLEPYRLAGLPRENIQDAAAGGELAAAENLRLRVIAGRREPCDQGVHGQVHALGQGQRLAAEGCRAAGFSRPGWRP